MFIATAVVNQSQLRRSETKGTIYIALRRSCKREQTGIYKHFIPTGLCVQENLLKKKKFDLCYTERERDSKDSKPET